MLMQLLACKAPCCAHNTPACVLTSALPRPAPPHRPREGAGWAEADELEWGKPGWMQTVARLADQGVDLVRPGCCLHSCFGCC